MIPLAPLWIVLVGCAAYGAAAMPADAFGGLVATAAVVAGVLRAAGSLEAPDE